MLRQVKRVELREAGEARGSRRGTHLHRRIMTQVRISSRPAGRNRNIRPRAAVVPCEAGSPSRVRTMATTILIADDNRANREALASLLESAGYGVSMAADGWEALMKAREERPALVISDVLMPKMDGYELARRLREDPALQSVGLIFYTAYFGEQDAKDLAKAHGVARVLVKPSDNDEILRVVREVLAARAPAAPRAAS